jgi:hypothetical protein
LEELIELDDEKKKIKDASSVGPMYLDWCHFHFWDREVWGERVDFGEDKSDSETRALFKAKLSFKFPWILSRKVEKAAAVISLGLEEKSRLERQIWKLSLLMVF